MPFREKTAWAMSLILIGAGLYYFSKVYGLSQHVGETAPPVFPFVIAYVILVTIASIITMSIIASSSGKDADAPPDEREKVIIDKAGHWSGYVLAIGIFGGLFHYWAHSDGNMLFHIAFASLMVSQIAEYILQIFLYRRGV